MRTIEVEGLVLFGIVAFVGLCGYTVNSCDKAHIREMEIEQQVKVYENSVPCATYDEFVSREQVVEERKGMPCQHGAMLSGDDAKRLNDAEWGCFIAVKCTCP